MKAMTKRYFHGKRSLSGRLLTCACAALLAIIGYGTEAASIEIPPAVEKKAVELDKSHADSGRVFAVRCSACHRAPDPAKTEPKPACVRGIPARDIDMVRKYLADVRTGETLYQSRCGRCHDLIDPNSHTADYWSKNLCTSDECFVKKLHGDEEQQLLLYLSSQAKKK